MSAPSSGGASRDGYGSALLKLASDPRVVVLEADLGKSTKSCLFRAENPERTVSMGIAEQNMMLVSAGMASSGKIPFASTFAIFTERAFEQVRNGIARPGLVVHICGSHGGIHTGTDGSSAQSIEDLAIYRTIPNMTVMHPCDDLSAEELTLQLLNHDKPSYTRTARNKVPRVYSEDNVSNIKIGKGNIIEEGNDVAIIACGVMVNEAKIAAQKLSENGINACVVDMHTIKPLDGDLIQDLAKQCGCIVTVEDHSVIGGLGGGVAEYLSRNIPTPLEMVGVDDRFGESGGTSELMAHLNINYNAIINACHAVIKRK
ncbi:TPA: transketolase family protein [Candidatus Thalassarchaeaceae archaeon]|nr:transketolase family protein [Euryarchaeota archaeon]MDG1547611.1 transketolase C-terminal domain-containing protein [Candidatus Thalassarchaeaceae archaeon]MDG1554258.1 transketolase C-terminal domain-containing protein [Candidatus Thalassarchaeaceae archaeon]DAC65137.1 MAG TPA: transketolase family protein [Candidatus Poseidoniales archaeon]HII42918.1 transketolase family protein [Candidatus Thalassarchaeaceae archaeon]|tara:strand:+ start:832 stop:1779 length:948 start_codon:yes stop_codon:yes gene_type:complete